MARDSTSELSILNALAGQEQRDPQTTLEFVSPGEGVLCGVKQMLTLLRSAHPSEFQLWALDEGAAFSREEVVLRWRGHLLQVAPHIHALTGVLGASSGWATAARSLVECAKPIPLVVVGAQSLYPGTFDAFAHAAVIGGCQALDSPLH